MRKKLALVLSGLLLVASLAGWAAQVRRRQLWQRLKPVQREVPRVSPRAPVN